LFQERLGGYGELLSKLHIVVAVGSSILTFLGWGRDLLIRIFAMMEFAD
jgi:hypothetical protein